MRRRAYQQMRKYVPSSASLSTVHTKKRRPLDVTGRREPPEPFEVRHEISET